MAASHLLKSLHLYKSSTHSSSPTLIRRLFSPNSLPLPSGGTQLSSSFIDRHRQQRPQQRPMLYKPRYLQITSRSAEAMAGSQCCENPPALSSGAGEEGSVVDSFGGLKAYVTGSSASTRAVILIADIFGFEAPNLRKLADKVAAAGFFAVVPDYFYGDPYVPDKGLSIMDWLKSHGTDKGYEDTKLVIANLKDNGISTIGAAGFCWGGKVVAELAKTGKIRAGVMLHPAFVTVDDIKETKVHLAILGAETDDVSPPELLKQFEEVLKVKSEVDSYVKIFPGVAHGWTTRYEVDNEPAVAKAVEAHQDLMSWLIKYL